MNLFDKFRPKAALEKQGASPEDLNTEPTGYQQTASKLHSFNRYEIKYFVAEADVAQVREELTARMDTDPFSPKGGYPVTSLYYDTTDLRFYWEKIVA